MDPWIPCQDTSQEYIPHITISGVAHHVSGVSGYWVDITISGISLVPGGGYPQDAISGHLLGGCQDTHIWTPHLRWYIWWVDLWIPCQDTSQEYIPHITISGVAHHVSGVSGYWVDITISSISRDLVVDTLRMLHQVYLVSGMTGYPSRDTTSEVVHLVGRSLDTMPGIPLGWYVRIPISGHPMRWYIWWVDMDTMPWDTSCGGLLRSIYIYILLLAIRYWWVDHPLLLLQVLRTLHRMSYTIPQDTHSADISTSSARSSLC